MMTKNFKHIYQFKITLKYTKPPVWRRIQVPETYDFWDLHCAIQDAMGWTNSHLHLFEMQNPITNERSTIEIMGEDTPNLKTIHSGLEQFISSWFSMNNRSCVYIYDMGDDWNHQIRLEKIIPREDVTYPRCLAGKRACPPEDCGSIPGYEDICRGESEFQENYEGYDPENFDAGEIVFDDPDKAWDFAYGLLQ